MIKFMLLFCMSMPLFAVDYPVKDVYVPRPNRPIKKTIRVEVVIKDDLSDDTIEHIDSVYFDGRRLSLSKTDYLGNRGRVYLKKTPGSYTVTWTTHSLINQSRSTHTYKEKVEIPKTASLVYVEINQDQLSVDLTQ